MPVNQANVYQEEEEEEEEGGYTGAATSSQDQDSVNDLRGFRRSLEAGDQQPYLKRAKVFDPSPMDIDKLETDDGGKWNPEEIDGLFCPICMEGWTTSGDHQVCCIPCGHIYGMSCIKRWLHQLGSRGKCPQCNSKCKLKDIRVLYASRIISIDEELQKQVRSLESRCASLEKKDADWSKKEYDWQKSECDLYEQIQNLRKRTSYLEGLVKDLQTRTTELSPKSSCQEQLIYGTSFNAEFGNQGSPSGYILLVKTNRKGCISDYFVKNYGHTTRYDFHVEFLTRDLQIEGARFFDVDVHSQTLIIARRLSGMGGSCMFTKISLLSPHERENIQLPVSTKVVKDLRVSPHARLALLASLEKKLSVFSTTSNNIVLTYNLPTAAWCCAWDVNNLHYLYAGLQNGTVLEFDQRQTSGPVESITGFTGNPIHTMYSLSLDSAFSSGVRSVLTASSSGLCHWNFGRSGEKTFLIPESLNQGVCISLAYGPECGDIVASFRPKIERNRPISLSQPLSTPFNSLLGQAVEGSHVYYKRVDSPDCSIRYQKLGSTFGNVNDIRLPRSAVIDRIGQNSCFAVGDEALCDLVLQELPSLKVCQRLKSLNHPIRDVKYSRILNSELLSCLSEDSLQLFTSKLP